MKAKRDLGGRLGVSQTPGDREYQEDDFGVIDGLSSDAGARNHVVLVLADGMGGHAGGDVASRTVVRGFIEAYQDYSITKTRAGALEESLHSANRALAQGKDESPELDGMGATLVAVAFEGHELVWISVGDSPLWIFGEAGLKRLNQDHSVGGVLKDLVELGKISQEEADADTGKNALRSAVDGDEIELIDGPSPPFRASRDDIVLLASDGIQSLSEEEIRIVIEDLCKSGTQQIADALMKAVLAKELPGQDNTTIMVFKVAGAVSNATSVSRKEQQKLPVARNSDGSRARWSTPLLGIRAVVFAGMLSLAALAWLVFGFQQKPEKPREPVDIEIGTEVGSRDEI